MKQKPKNFWIFSKNPFNAKYFIHFLSVFKKSLNIPSRNIISSKKM